MHTIDEMESALRNLSAASNFSFDIGLRVIKVVYTSRIPRHPAIVNDRLTKDDGTRLHCIHFPFTDLDKVCEYIAQRVKNLKGKTVQFTSTHQDSEACVKLIRDTLGVKMERVNDMTCHVKGTNFLLNNILDEVFVYDHHNVDCRYFFQTCLNSPHDSVFPYVLVNVGTGMSIVRVNGESDFEYIGGSHCGGGAFFGLAKLLIGSADIDELLVMAEDGDHRKVDSLVCDIYGSDYNEQLLGLPPDLIAGSFGKCSNNDFADQVKDDPEYRKDCIRSLLLMISNSVGQVVSLVLNNEKTNRLFFNGFMVRNHPIIMRTLSYAINFWSRGTLQAHFLRHEAFMAAIGGMVLGKERLEKQGEVNIEHYSWREHYAGCSDLGRFVPRRPTDAAFRGEVLELDCADILMRPFPLLSPAVEYDPDTVDLNSDLAAREFWLTIMEESVHKMCTKAIESQAESPTAAERADVVAKKYLEQLQLLRDKPFAYGTCNVRNLLDLREQIFQEHEFDDPFKLQKKLENDLAVRELPKVVAKLDSMDDARERLAEATKGLLAGNVFDWGAKEVVKLMEGEETFTFQKAIDVIPERPWLHDSLDEFLDETFNGSHKSIVVFVDNSGADVVLGVIPFAREFLKLGSQVTIVSNLLPALNDITYGELEEVMAEVAQRDELLKRSMTEGTLKIMHSGQGSPCLDLRRIDSKLCELVLRDKVDLVVIEGMGRALHTNFNAHFSVPSLKAAVIKTRWLADRMGGDIFSVVCKYEKNQSNPSQ
ncbi:hypothetical protein PENTCL1PPCAC_29578 [Pristionchus entomophagus]|uniref:4'-phosphopantetheine phosphatase n=1 Tax=Pristionchus entomophagus TaxID=358040 RepID=A0AAV5UNC6_9BILA|nr:hypothetical protein PENTCL1PPCAC_29578 [Pristionchus entomophagus]